MKHDLIPFRGIFLATAATVLAAFTALPLSAQGPCGTTVPGNGECRILGYSATFASAAGTIHGDTINLTQGWVLMTPRRNASDNRAVFVATAWAPGGISNAPVASRTTRPTFLVIAYQAYTALAVAAGTMGTPAGLVAGCEVWYTDSTNGLPSAPPFAISSDPGPAETLKQMGVSFPNTCPQ